MRRNPDSVPLATFRASDSSHTSRSIASTLYFNVAVSCNRFRLTGSLSQACSNLFRRSKINLHPNAVNRTRKPGGWAKCDTFGGDDMIDSTGRDICLYQDMLMRVYTRVEGFAGGIQVFHNRAIMSEYVIDDSA